MSMYVCRCLCVSLCVYVCLCVPSQSLQPQAMPWQEVRGGGYPKALSNGGSKQLWLERHTGLWRWEGPVRRDFTFHFIWVDGGGGEVRRRHRSIGDCEMQVQFGSQPLVFVCSQEQPEAAWQCKERPSELVRRNDTCNSWLPIDLYIQAASEAASEAGPWCQGGLGFVVPF